MNLWDIHHGQWNEKLLNMAAGSHGVEDLKAKLGPVPEDGGGSFGNISNYFVQRYGFPSDCSIIPFTGDNPSTILALPLQASDAMVSLGTSTTFLMSTKQYKPDPAYHFMNHPTTPGHYMFMLCYKNGGLAREHVRDAINAAKGISGPSWDAFNDIAVTTPPMAQNSPTDPMRMGLYFPRPEIVPNVAAGQWRYAYTPSTGSLASLPTDPVPEDARAIIESQMLSLRLRSASLVTPHKTADGTTLPAQPRRVYLVGGGSANPAIARICGEVLGGVEGVFKLDIGGNACALGAAYKAVWGCERSEGQTFEGLIGERWDEDKFVKRVADGYHPEYFEKYGRALAGFDEMEKAVLGKAGEESSREGGVVMADETGKGAVNQ